jgi:hypothetical protein
VLHFALQQRLVEVNIYRKLRARASQLGVGSQIGHPNPPLQISAKEEKESENQYLRRRKNLLRRDGGPVAFAACDARRTQVRLRFSTTTASARYGFSRIIKEKNTVFRRQNRRL